MLPNYDKVVLSVLLLLASSSRILPGLSTSLCVSRLLLELFLLLLMLLFSFFLFLLLQLFFDCCDNCLPYVFNAHDSCETFNLRRLPKPMNYWIQSRLNPAWNPDKTKTHIGLHQQLYCTETPHQTQVKTIENKLLYRPLYSYRYIIPAKTPKRPPNPLCGRAALGWQEPTSLLHLPRGFWFTTASAWMLILRITIVGRFR